MNQTATQQPTTEFVPDTGGTETTSAATLLVAAYLVLWLVLMGFIAVGWRRQAATSRRLDALERALGQKTP